MNHFRAVVVSLLYFSTVLNIHLHGQEVIADSSQSSNTSFFAIYPLLFYFPETRLGFGAATVYNYYPGKVKSSRPSQWQVGAAYTLNQQLLIYGAFQYFLRQNRTELFGEIGYYDYFYFYYGIGINTLFEEEETYFVRFPRLRINTLEQIFPNLRAGISYKFDHYDIFELKTDGMLDEQQPTGFDGGIISTIGAIIRFDTRDNINLPTKGNLFTLSLEHNARWLGSDFTYSRFLLDAITYIPLGSEHKQLIAVNLYGGAMNGDPPFQEFLLMGGSKKGRGIVEGRYRDSHILLLQGAYRFPIIWRFRGSIFASSGRVGNDVGSLWGGNWKYNYGAGIRFLLDPDEKIQIRLDVGLGSDQPGFYLTIGEAF